MTVFLLLASTAIAWVPKYFNDSQVSIQIEKGDYEDTFNVWWSISNTGSVETKINLEYGYSKYDYEKEKWVIVEQRQWTEKLPPGTNMGAGGLNTNFEPGYYMFWIQQTTTDKIKENNKAIEFLTVD